MAGLLDYLQNQTPVKREGEGSYLRQQFPKLYGALGGLLGTAPDEFEGSVLDPLTAEVRKGAEMGYLPGLIAGGAPPIKGAAGLGALAGMFVGKGSKTWDAVQATRAMELEKAGVDARKIWSETGTWKAPDGAWRQEIPDNRATAKSLGWGSTADLKAGNSTIEPLQETLQHSRLGRAYPGTTRGSDELGHNLIVKIRSGGGDSGSYGDGTISLGDVTGMDGSKKIQKSVALHEIQHYIQDKERWARGGNPGEFSAGPMFDNKARDMTADLSQMLTGSVTARPEEVIQALKYADETEVSKVLSQYGFNTVDDATKFLKAEDFKRTPYGQYNRLAGEAEARATQARIPLDATQRRQLFPADSYDVPMDQLIIRGLLK